MAPSAHPAAEGVPYYTPEQKPPVGTTVSEGNVPTVFTPLTIRGVTLNNRLAVAPMCTYSAEDGHLTDWHLVHLGQFAHNGAGLVTVEASAVQANGRISPQDSGIWSDSHIPILRRITDVVHAAGQKAAIQLGHAGRKASTVPPWIARGAVAGPEIGGWPDDLVSSSPIPYDTQSPVPKELSVADIKVLVQAWADAAKRAIEAGFDIIEIHGAHGYLNTQFLSPGTNKRTDEYGGSFENRTRLLREIIAAVRAVIPATTPLFLRISGTEWLEHTDTPSWTVADTIRLAKTLPALGIDLLDVSSGGNSPAQKVPTHNPAYQTEIAAQVRRAVRDEGLELLIGAVGFINEPEVVRDVVQKEEDGSAIADLAFVARQFLKEPNWVVHVAEKLGVETRRPVQYGYAVRGLKVVKERQRASL
ncbi:related to flavin oxidoreductase [Cephalotrichum gorgonifer]|uniref:Related to flavin oxidoreductase n=1 Tax=Cephalotrichum gorgonifer TaxID=2041049 RepID=A0AAE8SQJ8_9PEZI|nr:related to flavin oxidoreductase [Cephalotrichum gorgonifer]